MATADASKDGDLLDEHNAVLRSRILIRRLLKAEELFPEWLRRKPSAGAKAEAQ
jgi:hypothetical protein